MLAKLEADKGVLFDFTNNAKIKETGFAIEGKQVNGYVQGNNIAINIDSTSALNKVVGHEITHILKGTALYNDLANAVKELATTKGEYDSKLQSIAELYEGVEDANIENELTAELVGEYLFTDSDFINRLSAEKPTLFQKIFDEIKYFCKVATAGSKEARQLEKVKKTFEEAYRQKNNTATDDGVKYSINEKFNNDSKVIIQTIKDNVDKIDNNIKFEVQSEKIPDNIRKSDYVFSIFSEQGRNAINPEIGAVELCMSGAKSTVFHGFGKEKLAAVRAIKSVIENGNIIHKTENYDNKGYDRYFIAAKGMINDENAFVGVIVNSYPKQKNSNSKFYLHEAIITEEDSPIMTAPQLSVYTVSESSTNIISNPTKDVKKNSLSNAKEISKSDSVGRELSPEVVEYFKDSKVRDKDGNLLVLYHQTDGSFNVFDTHRQGAGSADNETPYGIFLKSSSKDIGLKGKNQMPLYANITNPLVAENRQELVHKISQLSVEYSKLHIRRQEIDTEYAKKIENIDKAREDFIIKWCEQNKDADSRSLYDSREFNEWDDAEDSVIEEWTAEVERVSAEGKKVLTEVLKENGYDGVILRNDIGSFGRSTDAYIALEPNQVKNIDNANPTTNEDIRYSLTDNIEDIAPVRERNNVYGEDIKLQPAPAEDIAPIGEDVTSSSATTENNIPDDYVPTEEDIKKKNTSGIDLFVKSNKKISQDFIDQCNKSFGIEKPNDYVHVQKQVFNTLKNEGFFTSEDNSRIDYNEDSGMVIETNKKGIKETFNGDNYSNFGKEKKALKLATIRKLPEIIKNGKLIADDVDNYHNKSSVTRFAYIESEKEVDGKDVSVKIDIKKITAKK